MHRSSPAAAPRSAAKRRGGVSPSRRTGSFSSSCSPSSSSSSSSSSSFSSSTSAVPAELGIPPPAPWLRALFVRPYVATALRWLARLVFSSDDITAGLESPEEKRQAGEEGSPHGILARERRFKFALLSITLLLCSLYHVLLLVLFCPGIEFVPSDQQGDSNADTETDDHAPAVFITTICTMLLGGATIFVIHHLLANIKVSAYLVLAYMNCSWWAVCILWGPISEFLASLVHVPVLAFSVLGYKSGTRALLLLLGQCFVYIALCFIKVIPFSGHSLKLNTTAQLTAIMCSYVLLGTCACIDERARALAVRLYQEAHAKLAKSTKAKTRYLASVSHGTTTAS